MLWIKYRRGEAIPKDMKYDDWRIQKNINGSTPLMLWI